MNKQQQKAYIKREIRELEDQEELFKQGLSSITSRKRYLESELVGLGAKPTPARKGHEALSKEKRQSLIAGLTKGSQLNT